MANIIPTTLPKELIKVFQVAAGTLPFRELTESEIGEASAGLVVIADDDSRRALLEVLPSASKSIIEVRLAKQSAELKQKSTAGDMYWIYDTLTFSRSSQELNSGLNTWFNRKGGGDRLKKLGLKQSDFDFIFEGVEHNGDQSIFKDRIDIGKRFFTLLMKVAQAKIELDNNIISKLFLIEFGGALNNGQEGNRQKRYDTSTPEYIGFTNIAKKVLANPSGLLTV